MKNKKINEGGFRTLKYVVYISLCVCVCQTRMFQNWRFGDSFLNC